MEDWISRIKNDLKPTMALNIWALKVIKPYPIYLSYKILSSENAKTKSNILSSQIILT
jgi:hypothetical protein